DLGPYVEASLRGGRLHSDWRSSDLVNSSGKADYDTSSGYFGFHVGAGYALPITRSTSVDLSANYVWTRVNSDNVTIDGTPFRLKSVKSSVSRLGAMLSHNFSDHHAGFIGVAWEHEFNGKARATVNGLAAPAPSLKGNTGI